LTNYAFTYSALHQGVQFKNSAEVHSLTDWSLTSTSPAVTIYDINGHGYSVFDSIRSPDSFTNPEGATTLAGEPTWAKALIDDTHITAVRVTEAGSCSVAGASGTIVVVRSPSASRSIFALDIRACIDTASGALLSYNQGVVGGSAPTAVGLKGASEVWTVTAIGGVGAIKLPTASAPTTTVAINTPTTPEVAIPPSFPSAVAIPPGHLATVTTIRSSKWYLLLDESTTTAYTQYTTTLEGDGFVASSNSTAGATSIGTLTKGAYTVVVEQSQGVPGSGNKAYLTVIVTSHA
jgi:hypothetical protein